MTKLNEYAKALRSLETDAGELLPEDVVREAQKKASPLHDYFDWNNKTAAHKYRIEQARELIRSVRVVVEHEERLFRVPNYVRDPEKEGRDPGYRAVARLRTDDELKRAAIVNEFIRAGAALRRARELAAYFGIEEPVDETLRSIERTMLQVQDRAQ